MTPHTAEDVRVAYLAVGANRQSAAADWSDDGLLCFGAGVHIATWRPSAQQGLACLLRGHQDTVKAVQFLPAGRQSPQQYLVSGGDDRSLRLWRFAGNDDEAVCVQTVEDAHAAPVNCLAAPRTAGSLGLLVSGAADATIKIWCLQVDDSQSDCPAQLVLLQTIQTSPRYFPLCLALVPLANDPSSLSSSTAWLLAAAGTSTRIQLFVGSHVSSTAADFALQATLSGHEGWLRSLDFARETSGDWLLASASQDKYIRLWRVHRQVAGEAAAVPTAAATSPADPLGLIAGSPANKAHLLQVDGDNAPYSVTFEALLLGHDDWIYSARWDRSSSNSSSSNAPKPLRLLSASADNSLAVWEADPASGIWLTSARLGELSKEKGATTATGSVGGFWMALWAPSGRSVVTLCRTGSWRRWDLDVAQDRWVQAVGVGGHTAAVTGVSWARNGGYLLSTSSDQTTRLHGEWRRQRQTDGNGPRQSWHEMARPQIHGYDLNCIDALGPTQFVSGADEKLMRVFHEPKTVARLVARLTGTQLTVGDDDVLPDAANMPVLGLSNKAVDDEEANTEDMDLAMDHPPFEDVLSRATLWPETEKLYGHGYEISCLAVRPDGRLVASACRASSLNHAVLRLFETAPRWTERRPPLAAHTLTATRLRFSPDGRFLLSVGRDRQWAVFAQQQKTGDGLDYQLYEANAKAHSRMLLDCAWAPVLPADGGRQRRVFATAGRDKNAKVWAAATTTMTVDDTDQTPEPFALVTTIPQAHPVTALDFLWRPSGRDSSFVLAVGTEAGTISVLSLDPTSLAVSATLELDPALCLPKAVLQLAWRPPVQGAADETQAELAIAGEDASLRVYSIER